jgi:heme/copper-type cytochrome/quinol oxidase subunit 3
MHLQWQFNTNSNDAKQCNNEDNVYNGQISFLLFSFALFSTFIFFYFYFSISPNLYFEGFNTHALLNSNEEFGVDADRRRTDGAIR